MRHGARKSGMSLCAFPQSKKPLDLGMGRGRRELLRSTIIETHIAQESSQHAEVTRAEAQRYADYPLLESLLRRLLMH